METIEERKGKVPFLTGHENDGEPRKGKEQDRR